MTIRNWKQASTLLNHSTVKFYDTWSLAFQFAFLISLYIKKYYFLDSIQDMRIIKIMNSKRRGQIKMFVRYSYITLLNILKKAYKKFGSLKCVA